MTEFGERGFTKIVIGESDDNADSAKPRRKASRQESVPGDAQREIERLRAELDLVTADRDRLRRELTSLESMQTDTRALDESWDPSRTETGLPSIDELLQVASAPDNAFNRTRRNLLVDQASDADETPDELIPAADIVLDSGEYRKVQIVDRFFALLDVDGHPQFPLDQDLLTIGRSESADIKIIDDSISRIHARVLRIGADTVVEDAGSKNGTRVNGEPIQRQALSHGDLVEAGTVRLRFVDPGAVPE